MQELVASGLVDIQAHSKSHRNLIERGTGETDDRYRQNIEAEVQVPARGAREAAAGHRCAITPIPTATPTSWCWTP